MVPSSNQFKFVCGDKEIVAQNAREDILELRKLLGLTQRITGKAHSSRTTVFRIERSVVNRTVRYTTELYFKVTEEKNEDNN